MGAGLFGYDLGVIAYVIVAPDFLRVTNNPDPNYMAFIVASLLLGYVLQRCLPELCMKFR